MKKSNVMINKVLNNRLGMEYLEKIAERYDILSIKTIKNGKILEVSIKDKKQ